MVVSDPRSRSRHRVRTCGLREGCSGILGRIPRDPRFWGLGFRVLGLGFRVLGLGFRVLGLGFRGSGDLGF